MSKKENQLDSIVIGAGFAGIYMLHKLRNELGLNVRSFERGSGIGGTWHWNRYPGAAADVDSIAYRYSFDSALIKEWNWKTRYAPQAEILAYLEHVVDRYELREDIQLNTTVEALTFDEATSLWTVRTDDGEEYTARYVVGALGPLSTANFPDIEGRESFAGTQVHTGAWPQELDITGKKVGVIGTGSTGTQFIGAAAKIADHLTVFQRSAQYVVPAGDGPLSEEFLEDYRENHEQFWKQVFNSRVACGFQEAEISAMAVSAEERERKFQESWDAGNGFNFMFGTFADIAFNPESNEAAASFIRSKIKEIVRDPETARKLMPTDYYAKRPICNTGYYESYNRDNVALISTKENPIVKITPKGVQTEDGTEHEVDVLVFATGYEAMQGSYNKIDIRGAGGRSLKEHWGEAPSSYLGVATNGFPNLFTVFGPNSVFSNLPPALQTQVEWISDTIGEARKRGVGRVEATAAAEEEWTVMCREMAQHSLFAQTDSWIFGSNIPGKERRTLFYFGGIAAYREKLKEIVSADYEGFTLDGEAAPSAV
ncbi:NAD(P)/FAD-dependent oxidoreductase [Streptomyces sp. NA04227]|uniref:flavin-containing monooxygenase n=1 Tax=Streptomyces sp. NA04227 TaxID=2742136 RepID=UPI001161D06E|nr:NAD(P)/FAD-dependent oxidoreductase [Streptomyces sp. NA04227]QDJ94213.1 SpzQ1 [Streptomyces sp.]QKW08096.1 NAD(P)/FAD-dependent oxidoreductase [Streptomyces sp. NA04227]